MKNHLIQTVSALVVVTILLALGIAPGKSLAQIPDPESPATIAPGAMPIQGKLTNASGLPLNGNYNIFFRLYEAETGGTILCEDTNLVTVTNGLFSSWIDYCYNGVLTGQKVWLAIKVENDPEMTPRQVIFPVAYALGLVPGVVINGPTGIEEVLAVSTADTTGKAVVGSATAASGANNGVYGSSASPSGTGGYFYNFSDGTGLSGISVGGTGVYAGSLGTALVASGGEVAISAEGTGRIKSTAKSYLFLSGNGVRPFGANDTTKINMDSVGSARISPGTAVVGTKNVILPITIPATLYGQNITISAVDIYWATNTAFDGITAVLLRRQIGVCETANCYVSMINYHPAGGVSCEDGVFPTGCTLHLVPAGNNELSSTAGILYLTIELNFVEDDWIKIGGVRLTLEHD